MNRSASIEDVLRPGSTSVFERPLRHLSLLRSLLFTITIPFVVALLSLIVTAHTAGAQNDFDDANRAFEQGRFKEAISKYEALLQRGTRSSAIFFNLGNACFRDGQLGKAIARYRNAERLTPRDPDLRANLDFARRTVQEGNAALPRGILSWSQRLTTNEWSLFFSGSIWLLFGTLLVGRLKPTLRPSLGGLLVTAAALLLVSLSGLGASTLCTRPAADAVIISPTAAVRYGPFDESQSNFSLKDGNEVLILDSKSDWLQIRDLTGRAGWLRKTQLQIVDTE